MNTPICDFVRSYAQKNTSRFHMPGHKGKEIIGPEQLDITEISGADELFAADGIIAESEKNAGTIFGAETFYSAGGSTLCIQAMLRLISLYAASCGKRAKILAARNAHKAFINAAALLEIDTDWISPEALSRYSCQLTPEALDRAIKKSRPSAVYITAPDYLGCIPDIKAISAVCRKNGVILAVDNAHGAYLKLLPQSLHPIDLGADICCDSAHKTLPVLTGGAYLHVSKNAPELFSCEARAALSLFASSSPSYLILQSLDAANAAAETLRTELAAFLPRTEKLRQKISRHGFETIGSEPLKLTVSPKSFGYTGTELAKICESNGIYPEFYDPDYVVFMLSPKNTAAELSGLEHVLCSLPHRTPIKLMPPPLIPPRVAMTPHEALLAPCTVLPIVDCCGKICAMPSISCPPAIPIAVYGELLDESAINVMRYYGITHCRVCL